MNGLKEEKGLRKRSDAFDLSGLAETLGVLEDDSELPEIGGAIGLPLEEGPRSPGIALDAGLTAADIAAAAPAGSRISTQATVSLASGGAGGGSVLSFAASLGSGGAAQGSRSSTFAVVSDADSDEERPSTSIDKMEKSEVLPVSNIVSKPIAVAVQPAYVLLGRSKNAKRQREMAGRKPKHFASRFLPHPRKDVCKEMRVHTPDQ